MVGVLGGDSEAYDSKTNLTKILASAYFLTLNITRIQRRSQNNIKF